MCRVVPALAVVALLLTPPALIHAAPLTYSGMVVDAAGKPVAEAVLHLVTFDTQAKVQLTTVKTDATGRFSYQSEPMPYAQGVATSSVFVTRPGLASAVAELQPGTPATITLGDKPEQRSGVVLGPDGKPLAGATVTPMTLLGAGNQPPRPGMSPPLVGALPAATTDAQGRFACDGFPAGLGLAATVVAEGCAEAAVQIMDATPVTVTLNPGAAVSGKVLVNGQPREGLAVNAYATGGTPAMRGTTGRTGPDGVYTLRGLNPGPNNVSVVGMGGMATPPAQQVALRAGETLTEVDFSFTPGGLIRGQVTDAKTGQPVPKCMVHASLPAGRSAGMAQVDAQGKYELRLPPGSYVLNAQAMGGGGIMIANGRTLTPGTLTVTVKEGEALEAQNLTVRLPRTVKGQVLLPDGTPATGATVTQIGGSFGPPLRMQPEARFEVTVPDLALPPGQAFMRSPTLLLAVEPALKLAAFCNQDPLPDELTLKLQPAATLTLLITDQQNRPLPGFGIAVGYPLGERGSISQSSLRSDERGLIQITGLPANVPLRLMPDQMLIQLLVNRDQRSFEVTLQPGEERVLPPLVVNPEGRTLNVFVGAADGQPVAGALVYSPGLETPARTDAAGKVTLSKLPLQGKVLVFAMHPTQEHYAAEVVDPDAGVWPGLIVKPMGRATGLLIAREGGKPLEGWDVSCWAGSELYQMRGEAQRRLSQLRMGQTRVRTDAQGRWHADNLLPGVTYQLAAGPAPAAGGPPNMRLAGSFRAAGGAEEQDTGVFECELPAGE